MGTDKSSDDRSGKSKHHTYGEFSCPWDGCDHVSTTRQGLGKHFKPVHGTTLREYERQNNDGEHKCPECGDIFDTDRGVKVHYSRSHGGSIAGVEVECSYCGESKTVVPDRVDRYNKHYCNNECRAADDKKRTEFECDWCGSSFEIAEWRLDQSEKIFCPGKPCYGEWLSENNTGENHPNWQSDVPRAVACSNCGDQLSRKPQRILYRSENFFCDRGCEAEWKREKWPTGPDNPLYTQVEVECTWCGDLLQRKRYYVEKINHIFCRDTDCRAKWQSERSSGENNPNWNPNYVDEYGTNWSEQRGLAIARDEFMCQDCGISNEEYRETHSISLDVHHIQPISTFEKPEDANQLSNLITLCRVCHRYWEKMSPLRPQTAAE